jgi:hypothetical protein
METAIVHQRNILEIQKPIDPKDPTLLVYVKKFEFYHVTQSHEINRP